MLVARSMVTIIFAGINGGVVGPRGACWHDMVHRYAPRGQNNRNPPLYFFDNST
ncbi:MAG: hypothetical protein ORN57_02735 [Alphaproteobacteria bacterium]|nr:hypothetical protein [Alphaproteobacteria bacterium]